MEWMGLNEIRERFLSFFEGKGHYRLESAPLIPQGDNSLLLINSGMAPLKKYFLGLEAPPARRATSCQKCIRTPDIERVGKTSRHGTFFEMLGNFSFGDYFKKEATAWAWEFITKEMKIPVDKLWISIYEDDDETFDIWTKEIGVDPGRVVRLGKEDNFWEIGSGPCGPCSEIYFDRGEAAGCSRPDCAVGCDCDRYVEFWNLVFTQYNSDGKGSYVPLEHPNIDTGMGLERLACIMQGVGNLFEVDTIQNIMGHVSRLSGVSYGADPATDVSLRVITDHIRSTVFMVGDGVTPQNEGRGYVLRRLLRRAARHGRLLGIRDRFLYEVARTVIEQNAGAYPGLQANADFIVKVIHVEEERFQKTIEQGMQLLNELVERNDLIHEGERNLIPGSMAFKLYDTFGFPIDLIKEIASERGIGLEEDGFQRLMEEQRNRARQARNSKEAVGWANDVLAEQPEFTDAFVGYDRLEARSDIRYIIKEGAIADAAEVGEEAILVLDQTPFYAESGGQVGDVGTIVAGESVFTVTDTKKSPTGHILHIGRVDSGELQAGIQATAQVDAKIRQATMRNHSSCHLLQAALRQVLGNHVHQAGSYVDSDQCRFDFSHFSAMTVEELEQVETLVNEMILDGLPVDIEELELAKARERGAMALFGEKYGNIVRVCSMGDRSIELCGGTHVENTSRIGLFKIVSESSVAAGVRRIEATSGFGVMRYISMTQKMLLGAAHVLKLSNPSELVERVSSINQEIRQKDKTIEQLGSRLAGNVADSMLAGAVAVGPVKVLSSKVMMDGADGLRALGDTIKEKLPEGVALLATDHGGKVTMLVVCGKDAVKSGAHAGNLMKKLASLTGGNGGGRPDSAMGGTQDRSALRTAMDSLPAIVKETMGI